MSVTRSGYFLCAHVGCARVTVQKWSLNVIVLKKTRPDYEPPDCDYKCIMKDKMKDIASGVRSLRELAPFIARVKVDLK